MHTMVDLDFVQIISKHTIFSLQPFSILKNSNRFFEIVERKIYRLPHNPNVSGDKIVWIECETIRLVEGEK